MKKGGISLVALVVTIIVLIILTAGVVSTFMNEGIMDNAEKAVKQNDEIALKETYAQIYSEKILESKIGKRGEIDKIEVLKEALKETGIQGFDFSDPNEPAKYTGDNEIVEAWALNTVIHNDLNTELDYIFSIVNGTRYITGFHVETEEEIYAIAPGLRSIGYDCEGEYVGAEYEGEEVLVTGDKILKDGKEIGTILIKGDVAPDGLLDSGDIGIIVAMLELGYKGTDIELLAADIDNDGDVDEEDLNKMLEVMDIAYHNIYQNVELKEVPTVIPKKK